MIVTAAIDANATTTMTTKWRMNVLNVGLPSSFQYRT
jgi:hypothetical protein